MSRAVVVALRRAEVAAACEADEPPPFDAEFGIPRTEAFAPSVTAHGLFEEPPADLVVTGGTASRELTLETQELFTHHAHEQRLVRLGTATFPEGATVAKTSCSPLDVRDDAGVDRAIETRPLRPTGCGTPRRAWEVGPRPKRRFCATVGRRTSRGSMELGQPRATAYAVQHEGEAPPARSGGARPGRGG